MNNDMLKLEESESEDDVEPTSKWRGLTWTEPIGLKAALRHRGITHTSFPTRGTALERRAFIDEQLEQIVHWEATWPGGARPA